MTGSGTVRWMWCRGARRALACCGALAAAALAGEDTAAASVFHYVDRDGVAHQIEVGGAAAAPAPAQSAEGEYPFAGAVQEAARLYSLPVELLLAVITVESGFEPKVISPRGAMGLMQVMPATAAEMKISDSFDPRENLLGGARYLRIVINAAAGDLVVALGSYNAGTGATQRYGGVPPFRDTHQYVASVVRFYRMYKARGPGFASVVAGLIREKKGVAAPVAMGNPVGVPQTPPEVARKADAARRAAPKKAGVSGNELASPRRPKKRRPTHE
jgi:Transglycosylase SLT domain